MTDLLFNESLNVDTEFTFITKTVTFMNKTFTFMNKIVTSMNNTFTFMNKTVTENHK